jgi:hypothetical protein
MMNGRTSDSDVPRTAPRETFGGIDILGGHRMTVREGRACSEQ